MIKIKVARQAQDDSPGVKGFDEWLSFCGPQLNYFRNAGSLLSIVDKQDTGHSDGLEDIDDEAREVQFYTF